MSEKSRLLEISVLVTREEYGEYVSFAESKKHANVVKKSIVLGLFIVIASFIGTMVFPEYVKISLCSTFLVAYVAFVVFALYFVPRINKSFATNEYEQSAFLQYSNVYTFFDDGTFHIKNNRISGDFHLRDLRKWGESPSQIFIDFSSEMHCQIPKRLLTDDEYAVLINAISGA